MTAHPISARRGSLVLTLILAFAGCNDNTAGPNVAPVADAGADQDVAPGATVTLDAAGSMDADGGALTYTWIQVSGPSVGALSGAQPSFTAPSEIATLEFDVVANDGEADSSPDRVVVRVLEDPAHALWVGPGGDDGNPGTRTLPFATIQAAIDAADLAGDGADVYIGAATYEEDIALASDVSLYGGYDAAWLRDAATSVTTIAGGTTAISGAAASGLTIDGFTITSAAATVSGTSSIALLLSASVGVAVAHNSIVAGDGAAGDAPSVPPTGTQGGGGASGASGGAGGTSPVAGREGGAGGAGQEGPGQDGQPGGGPDGGTAGAGGGNGQPGGPGGAGAPGSDGSGGAPFGDVAATGYVTADGVPGDPGEDGSGGGGGGGGSGDPMSGRSGGNGGGGGGGGQHGVGGLGGIGGGASIGILVVGASDVTVSNNTITTGGGGAGGAGGSGGTAGLGGTAGTGEVTLLGDGGSGGVGGAGGDGGAGGGGGGGPSVGIVEDATSTTVRSGNTFTIGTPGAGGASAGSPAAAGEQGDYKKLP